MYYLLPIPVIIIAVIVNLVSNRYKLKIFEIISKIIIILGILLFIYLYCAYLGYDILDYVKMLLSF